MSQEPSPFSKKLLHHLVGPLGSVIIHILVVVILVNVAVTGSNEQVADVVVELDVTPSQEALEEVKQETPPEEMEPQEVEEEITQDPNINDDMSDSRSSMTEGTGSGVGDGDQAGLQITQARSPLVMKGLYGGRDSGGRAKAMGKFGAKAGSEEAVIRTLRWLKKVQSADGSWTLSTANSPKPPESHNNAPAAMTGLALLTFLAHGETPASEEFGETVEKAMRWMLANQNEDGSFKNRDGNDYTHPIATYALCEAYGLTKVPPLKEAAKKAIKRITKGQYPEGSWDYNLKIATDATKKRMDSSYAGWCIQALKAAKMAGFAEDDPDIEKALKRAVIGMKIMSLPNGAFKYTADKKEMRDQGGLTGVGVLCLQLLGAGNSKEVKDGLKFLDNASCNWRTPWGGPDPLYYWYYTTQAKFHAGGDTWKNWNKEFATTIIGNQTVMKGAGIDGKDIGYWKVCSEKEHCQSYVYNTTLCTLMLQVYYRYLPTYQPPEATSETDATSGGDVQIQIDNI